MRLGVAVVAVFAVSTSQWVPARSSHVISARAEPSHSFALLDRKLTELNQQQTNLAGEKPGSLNAARAMRRTVTSIDHTAFRLQSFYAARNQKFGVRMFRLLRLRAAAVNRAIFELARDSDNREAELKILNSRVIELVIQFQAASGGYSALRCQPGEWTCCSPKRKEDLRQGETVACRWTCTSKPQACSGFRGPRTAFR